VITYRVVAGDCLASIAHRYGLPWQVVWNEPANSELRAQRKNPNILFPGDTVNIPVPTASPRPVRLGRYNAFSLKGEPSRVRVRFLVNGEPLRNRIVEASVDGRTLSTTTDDEGNATIPISPATTAVDVTVDGWLKRRFAVGHLDPIDTATGLQARLLQLGLYSGKVDGILGPLTDGAVRVLQKCAGLSVTGTIDHATRTALEKAYGA
jgi:hypothetical protein